MIWVLSGLAETAVTIPWVMFAYWASGLSDWPAAIPGVWVLLFAYGAAAAWESGRPAASATSPQGRVIAMIGGLAVVYLLSYETLPLSIRPESRLSLNVAAAVLPPAAYLWYQGAKNAAAGLEYGRLLTRFTQQAGSMVIALLVLTVSGLAGDPRVQVLLLWSIFLLFGAGSTLVILARERALRQDQARHGDSGAESDTLSPAAVALVGGLLAATLIASYLLSVQRLLGGLETIGRLVAIPYNWIVDVAMLILVRWMILIVAVVTWIGSLIPRPKNEPTDPLEITAGEPPPTDDLLAERVIRDWDRYLKVALILVTIIAVVVLVYRLVSLRKTDDGSDEEQRIGLGFWRALLTDLRELFQRKPVDHTAQNLDQEPQNDDLRDPRALFRRLQRWGTRLGRPRHNSETPLRYGAALTERRPEAEGAVAEVTRLYNRARYGPDQPDPEAVHAAAKALEKLQASQGE